MAAPAAPPVGPPVAQPIPTAPPQAGPPPSVVPAPWGAAPTGPVTVPPQEPPPARAPGGGGSRRGLLIGLLVVCLVAAAGGAGWFFLIRDDNTEPASSSSSAPAYGAPQTKSESASDEDDKSSDEDGDSGASASARPSSNAGATASTSAAPTVSPEQQALNELETLRNASLSRLVLDGRWVAQVASKSVGITDPLQTAANGTHIFYAVDILAESKAATSSVASSSALVLRSTDFGKRSYASDGQGYWVTLVDVGFTSSDEAESWCASTFSTLTPEQLANACAARTLAPPHD